jgi:UrcA family protein
MNTRLATVSALVSLLTSGGFSASAAEPLHVDAPSQVVHFSDLDVSTPAGARALHARIANAAFRVCREARPGQAGVELVVCQHQLTDAAVADLNNPTLTALHTGQEIEITARR